MKVTTSRLSYENFFEFPWVTFDFFTWRLLEREAIEVDELVNLQEVAYREKPCREPPGVGWGDGKHLSRKIDFVGCIL